MADSYLGEVRMFSGHYAPNDWALCQGQLLKINEHQALFAIMGTIYGGDGVNTFALPNLNGRTPIGKGQGTGLTNRVMGQTGGAYHASLDFSTMPSHTHAFNTANVDATTPTLTAGQTALAHAKAASGTLLYVNDGAAGSATVALSSNTVSVEGAGQSHENVMPCAAINFIISLNGVYPQQ